MRDHDARPLNPPTSEGHLRRGRWLGVLILWLLVGSVSPARARVEGPADPLFRLVPPDSGMVLAVEDFRSGIKRLEATTLLDDLKKLPLVTSWLASDRFNRYRRAVKSIEAGLGFPLRTIVDEILGDAWVLVLQAEPNGAVQQSSGLLMIRPRQRKLLEQLVEARNFAQLKQGGLVQVLSRKHGAVNYQSRLFQPGRWSSDHYVFLDDGTFAWSSSEATIIQVIDRRGANQPGWNADPSFARVRGGLPDHALASLYVTPAFVARGFGSPRPETPTVIRALQRLGGTYLKALTGIGFAVEWRDGPVIHSHEVVDPTRLPGWMASWMDQPARSSPLLDRVPESAFGLISARFDFAAALRVARTLVEEDDRMAWDTVEQASQGLALGQPIDGLLEMIDPHLLLTLGPKAAPDVRNWFGMVGTVAWLPSSQPNAPWLAADNAFRTGMAIHALRSSRHAHRLRVETRDQNGRPVIRLGLPERSILAVQIGSERMLVGNTAEAIGQYSAVSGSFLAAASSLREIQQKYAPDAETFAVFDLPRLADAVDQSRASIVRDLAGRSGRPNAEVEHDLTGTLALARLFRGAVLTSKVQNNSTEIHRTIGLIAR